MLGKNDSCVVSYLRKIYQNAIIPFLSYDVTVIWWIKPCHKNRMTTRVITFWRVHISSLTTSISTIRFLSEIILSLKAIKSHFERVT